MLSKSNLLSWRQCPRKLWLEWNRKDLLPKPSPTNDRRVIDGAKVEEKARDDLGAVIVWPPRDIDQATAAANARALLAQTPNQPAVEVPMVREDLYVRADALVPLGCQYILRETKASTFPLKSDGANSGEPKKQHLDDVAIQAWVMEASGLSTAGVELNLLDSQWRYPGNGDYAGLFRQLKVTELIADRKAQVPNWLQAARASVDGPLPAAVTGPQCKDPYQCPFIDYCKTLEPKEPEHPIELLPDAAGKRLAKKLKDSRVCISNKLPDSTRSDNMCTPRS